jgi:hypothetical protein
MTRRRRAIHYSAPHQVSHHDSAPAWAFLAGLAVGIVIAAFSIVYLYL